MALLSLGSTSCNYPFEVEARVEVVCDDGFDGDGDLLTDCDDPDCADQPACLPPEDDCENGLDDDEDGLTDCDDPDCAQHEVCRPVEQECSNDHDDDDDGLTDCDDPDCNDAEICNTNQPCDEDGICESFENRFWCSDCCPPCELGEGTVYDYIITEVEIPVTAEEAKHIGVDMDGDGQVDNALGNLLSMFPDNSGEGINNDLAFALQQGEFILLGRLYVSSWPNDDAVTVQMFQGSATYDATEDNLTGHGHTYIDPVANRTKYVCGELVDSMLDSCPSEINFPFYLADTTLNLPLHNARMKSSQEVTDATWVEMMLGGGADQQAIDDNLMPMLLIYMNQAVLREPDSTLGNFVTTFVDGACHSELPGCDQVVNGEGDCSPWSGDPQEPPLTLTELRCNSIIQEYLEKDVDSDGDGVNDLISFGVRMEAVKVYIDN